MCRGEFADLICGGSKIGFRIQCWRRTKRVNSSLEEGIYRGPPGSNRRFAISFTGETTFSLPSLMILSVFVPVMKRVGTCRLMLDLGSERRWSIFLVAHFGSFDFLLRAHNENTE